MKIILILFIAYLGISYLYTLFMTVTSLFYKDANTFKSNNKHSYAIVIPAYKEDHVIAETVLSAVRQQYQTKLYKVFVIADQLKETTKKLLSELGAVVINVEFEKSTKVKSLKKYSELYGLDFDYTVLLDADNCIEPTFLKDINEKINILICL